MKARILFASLVMILTLGAGCSTAKVRVMPGEDGVNRVVVRDIERDNAEEAAVDAANDYCKKHGNKEAVFSKDSTRYTGSMNENTRNTLRKASKVAMLLGTAGMVPDESRPFGAALGTAGIVGTSMTNDRDYKSEVKFKCR